MCVHHSVFLCACVHLYACVCVRVPVCVCVCVCACLHVCAPVCMHMYVYTHSVHTRLEQQQREGDLNIVVCTIYT